MMRTEEFGPAYFKRPIAAMPIRNPIMILATLLFLILLAPLTGAASAHVSESDFETEITSSAILSISPLNVVVFEVSRR